MRRRDIVMGLAGTALWKSATRAQQPQRPKTIALLTGVDEDNPVIRRAIEELRRALQARGWNEGDNLQIIYRFAAGEPERVQRFATELVGLQPDLIVAHTAVVVAALHRTTRTLPVVFVSIPDPVADGFVVSLARPGGNMTGFTNYDCAIGGKWVEILKEIAPATKSVAVLLNPEPRSYSAYSGYWQSVEAGA